MKKEYVYSITDRRKIYVYRQSNSTLVVPQSKQIIDSDMSMLEDHYGNRYVRRVQCDTIVSKVYYLI